MADIRSFHTAGTRQRGCHFQHSRMASPLFFTRFSRKAFIESPCSYGVRCFFRIRESLSEMVRILLRQFERIEFRADSENSRLNG